MIIQNVESHGKRYQVVNGTFYHAETSPAIIELLESIRTSKQRVRFHWGNTTTGEDWGDTYHVWGAIGRSMGPVKVPILLHNVRSTGGGAILDHCVVKITASASGRVLYQHPNYKPPKD